MHRPTNAEKKEDKEESPSGMMQRMLDSRTIIISGQVDMELAEKVIQQLVLLDHADSSRPITVLVNCPGGEVFSGFAIFDMLRFITAPVATVVTGFAASMGSIIAIAPPKGRRHALPNAKFLIHQPLMSGYQGRAADVEIQANEILRERDRIVQLYAETTGRKAEDIARDIDRDRWMTAEDAHGYGLVDHIITRRDEIDFG